MIGAIIYAPVKKRKKPQEAQWGELFPLLPEEGRPRHQ
jgi:hypothetical protein